MSVGNDAPEGLSTYVQGRDGTLRSLVEVYIPETAEVLSVTSAGEPIEFRPAMQAGRRVIGVYIEVPRGERRSFAINYALPPIGDDFKLEVTPQPLARDARLNLTLQIPDRWVVDGPGDLSNETFTFSGTLDSTLSFIVRPDARTGISGLWAGLRDFLRDPLF